MFLVPGSQGPTLRVSGSWVLGSEGPGSQGLRVPGLRVSGSRVSGSQGPRVPGLRVSGFRVPDLRVSGPGSQILILDCAFTTNM